LNHKIKEKCETQIALTYPNNQFLVDNSMKCLKFYADEFGKKNGKWQMARGFFRGFFKC
jgi:hypothetical protein